MLNLRSVSSLLLKLFFLDISFPKRESKLMNPRFKLSRVGPFQLPSRRFIAFMGWPFSSDDSSTILAYHGSLDPVHEEM